MGKFVLSFLSFFFLASTAGADYDCTTNRNAQGCNPPTYTQRASEIVNGVQVSPAGQSSNINLDAGISNLTNLVNQRKSLIAEANQLAAQGKTAEANFIMENRVGGQNGLNNQITDQYNSISNTEEAQNAAALSVAKLTDEALEQIPSVIAAKTASKACTLGLDPGQKMMVQFASQQAMGMLSQGGTEASCKAAKGLSAILGAANAAHGAMCQTKVSACNGIVKKEVPQFEAEVAAAKGRPELLEPAKQKLAAAQKAGATCSELQGHVIAATMAAMQNLATFVTSGKCQKAVTNATPPPGGPTPAPYDCTNPMLASQASCICAANPADPVCTASNGGLGDGGGFASVGDGSGAVDGGKDPEMFGFDEDSPLGQANNGGGAAAQGSSGGGGGMNGGGGAGALPPEEMGGAGAGPYNTDVMGGLTGGGGGGGSSFGRGGGGSGDGSGGGLFDSLAAKFNLKGFLPSKGDFKNRGLASGMADGITGPNGPSLFEKVSSRYLKKQSELLP